ncbi:MAG: hypothetical protein A2V85_17490 [Chloroflexi bacterium RBG_16_72_14]|nr:MAG: hypothetical protein A2V85_17490 [Chloroflexi bacterium RBG_16_72_14]
MTEAAAPPPSRARWRATLGAAFVTTLVRPASWAFGLAGFLAGGGLVIVAWPILVLPTPTGLQNALGGPVSTLVFGGVSPTLALLFLAAFVVLVTAVVGGTWVGAWAERQGIAVTLEAAADEGLAASTLPDDAPGPGGVALVRLLSLLPVLVVLGYAWAPVYDAAYRQLILPDELTTPLPIRVMRDVPELIAAVLITWLLSDAAAAVAVRRLLLERRGVLRAWALGWLDLVRRPGRVLGAALAGLAVLVLLLGPSLLASSVGWSRVRDVVVDGRSPLATLMVVLTWVAMWLGGLVLAGVAAAFRSAAWTFELTGRR